MTEAEIVQALGVYFSAEEIAKLLETRFPGYGGLTALEIAQNEPERFLEVLEGLKSIDRKWKNIVASSWLP